MGKGHHSVVPRLHLGLSVNLSGVSLFFHVKAWKDPELGISCSLDGLGLSFSKNPVGQALVPQFPLMEQGASEENRVLWAYFRMVTFLFLLPG